MDLMEARNTLDTKNKVLYICKYFILLNLVEFSVLKKKIFTYVFLYTLIDK